jgi:hypothetical protein
MLSEVEGQIKGKTDETVGPVPIWEYRTRPNSLDSHKHPGVWFVFPQM